MPPYATSKGQYLRLLYIAQEIAPPALLIPPIPPILRMEAQSATGASYLIQRNRSHTPQRSLLRTTMIFNIPSV